MKVFLFLLLSSFNMYAHEYFFAFAEVEYNETSQKIEATLTVSTHDLEHAIEKELNLVKHLEKIEFGTKEFVALEGYLLKYFKIETDKKCKLKLIGLEESLQGITNFYFESEKIEIHDEITISFDLLMKQNKKQQNKVTFYHKNKNYTRPFLYSQRLQTIKLNKH